MAHYNFRKDLVDGADGQNDVVSFLIEHYQGQLHSSNDTNSHDVIINFDKETPFGQGDVSFEIKTDLLITPIADTGNMFVEVESRGKASGVEVCQATWFAYYLKHFNQLWVIKTEDLRTLIKESNFRWVYGGDTGSGTRGMLIPRLKNRDKFFVFKTTNIPR